MTFEGDGGSGKGTSVTAVAEALTNDDRRVLRVDQGAKFRTLGYYADKCSINLDSETELLKYLEAESTRTAALGLLGSFALKPEDDVYDLLHTSRLDDAAKLIAQQPASHRLAVGIMFDQVDEAAHDGIDTVLIDGRAMEPYGREMHDRKLGVYPLAFYFRCDSLIAAQRRLKDFRDVEAMSNDDQQRLLRVITRIAKRNADDSRRDVDPMENADHAFNLNLLRGLPEDPDLRLDALDQIIETGVVSTDTSYTRSKEQMTGPVVEITRHVLQDTDRRRASQEMLRRARQAFMLEPYSS